MTANRSTPDRARLLRTALHRPQSIGPVSLPVVIGLASGFVASFVIDALLFERIGTPWRQFVDAGVFVLVAAPVWLTVQRPAVRHAHETLTWLQGWETERWQREVGRRLPGPPRMTPELLDHLPDTMGLRPLHVELLAVRGELDEARRRLDLLPADTPWQRFERAALSEWIAWWADEPDRTRAMEAALPDDDAERALVARVMLATARARRAALAGGDAVGLLAAERAALGKRPARYAFGYGTGVVVSIVLVALVASLAVTVLAAVIR